MKGLAREILWWAWALPLLAGCGGAQAVSYYQDEGLNQTTAQALAYDGDTADGDFSDDFVDVSLRINNDDSSAYMLSLSNKTGAPIIVGWDRLTFIDAAGNRQRMIHHGVDYWAPLDALKPGELPPFATLTDLLRPAKVVHRDGAPRLAPLRGSQDTSNYLDQRLRIDLPLSIHGRVSVYRFRFHVEQPLLNPDPVWDDQTGFGP